MDIWDIGRILVRRWYVAGPVLVLALGLAMFMSGRVNPAYSTEASLLLVALGETPVDITDPSVLTEADGTQPPGNPYLNFPTSLATVAQATGLSVTSDEARRGVAELGLEPDYEVVVESRSPLLYVRVTSGDSEKAIATMDHVVELIEADLAERQDAADAPEDVRIEVEVLARSDQAATDKGGRSRVRLTVAGLGVLVAVGAAVLFDAAVTRRRPPDDESDDVAAGPSPPSDLDLSSLDGPYRPARPSNGPLTRRQPLQD